jgi:uridylate kinase
MDKPRYQRILLKLSGEALSGERGYGIDSNILNQYAAEIKNVVQAGVQVAIVIGGGNIFRGKDVEKTGIDRVQGDHMGMMATIINGIAIQASLEKIGLPSRLLSAVRVEAICEPYIQRRAVRHLEKNRVIIFGAGTGNPFFTTDSAASLRANEIGADVVLKGTKVDGVYTADPAKDPTATRYTHISFDEVIAKELNVMDMTAFTLCRENNLPIVVFDMNQPGNLHRIVMGDDGVGTLIS